ncbi:MAG: hypothetical protein AB4426_18990 [Xenococcaceae cyanobacterium]
MKSPLPFFTFLALTLAAIVVPTVAHASVNRIVELQGEVSIKKKNGAQYRPASVGTTLEFGDLLWPQSGAVVMIRCADGKLKRALSGVESGLKAICPGSRYSRDPREENIFLLLLTSQFIYETQFLEDKPLLRWQPIQAATRYRVRVMAADEVVWEEEVSGTEVRYGGSMLQPGVDYQLVVEAVDGQGTGQVYQLGFKRLNGAQVQAVQAEVAQIKGEYVGEEAKALMLADFYREVGESDEEEDEPGLLMAAIAVLEALVEKGNQTPVVRSLLGDLYLRTGMLGLAEIRYLEAVELAGNNEELAAIQAGLAHVYAAMGNLAESKRWLSRAKDGYVIFGNTDRAGVVDQWLQKLNFVMEEG